MILLTGATGFVGRNLLNQLIKEGYRVRCLVRNPERVLLPVTDAVQSVRGDILTPSDVMSAMDGDIDTVIHLVGVLRESKGVTYEALHVDATRNVTEAMVKNGVSRYLHISALGTRPNAVSLYHKTKWAAEEIVRGSGLDYTIFRPSVIFGREDKFTNLFAGFIRSFPLLIVPGTGKNLMQPVYIDNLTAFMLHSIKDKTSIGRVYDVAGPEELTFDEIIDKIASSIGRHALKVHIPLGLIGAGAALAETLLASPPVTRAELPMLAEDNITKDNALRETPFIKMVSLDDGLRKYFS